MTPEPRRRQTGVLASYADGWRRLLRAPVLAVFIPVAVLAASMPAPADGGARLQVLRNADVELARLHGGLGETLGIGGAIVTVLIHPSTAPVDLAAARLLAVTVGLWLFLAGGILDRLARQRPIRTAAFFAASGVFFVRFVRLALLVGPVYVAVVRWLWEWPLPMLGLLAAIHVIVDIAQVRAVVEDRRSMIGAIVAAMRFIRHRLPRVAGLYLLNLTALAVLLLAWSSAFPAAVAAGAMPLVALIAAGELVVRTWIRLAFMAAEVSFFQGELAHAHYAAAPVAMWPESPSAEGLRNLLDSRKP